MAKKKTTVYDGPEMHMGCNVSFVRTRLVDRTLVRCPKCNFLHISIDDLKIKEENRIEKEERDAKLLDLKPKKKKNEIPKVVIEPVEPEDPSQTRIG